MGELVLPSALADRPFTVREARAAGLRYDQLRAAPLHAPTWAVRCLEEPGSLSALAAAFARGLPDDIAFSHVTAARLWRLPLPLRLERDDDLDVIRDFAKERIRRRGCRGHRGLERLPAGSGAGLLGAALHARVSPRGKVLLLRALPLVRSGARSAMETRARLMFHRARFPEPELNAVAGARRRACLRRFARALDIDPAELSIG